MANPTNHWAFQPIGSIPPPAVREFTWTLQPLDRFVLAKLEAHALQPSPPASPETLLRRLSLDLRGVPPSPSEVEAFRSEAHPGAYEGWVDRFLASPQFGERWGRHWLDLARYADSDGYEKDGARPFAYHYRDWVIEAFNRDLPYDEFTRQQLAGDLLLSETASEEQRQRLLTATGFHRQTLTNKEGGVDPEEDRCKNTVDRTSTTGTVWLGLTAGCAECHHHKYDPLSQTEFYSLYAFFNSVIETNVPTAPPAEWQSFERAQAAWEQERRRLQASLEAARKPENGVPTADAEERKKALEAHQKKAPNRPPQHIPALAENIVHRPTHVHVRGDFLRPGEAVQPAFFRQIGAPAPPTRKPRLDRRDLVDWLMSPANPLTARVAANRIWQHLFGFGLVRTPNDFGTRGDPPSHPELLDWLAGELQRNGWSQKALIRRIVLSATYRQASNWRPEIADLDPQNRWLARQNRFRLDAESIRDSALWVSGLLDSRIGGPSVRPPLSPDIVALAYAGSVKWPESTGGDRYRRGLYTFLQRTVLHPMLTTFDAPDSVTTCTRRERSNTPLQALALLNDPLFFECAQRLARRAEIETPELAAGLKAAFQMTLGRSPTTEELGQLQALRANVSRFAESPDGGRLAVARALLNLEEFITRE